MAESAAIARALALPFLTASWEQRELVSVGQRVLGSNPAWLKRLVRQVLRRFREPPLEDLRTSREQIERSRSFRSSFTQREQKPRLVAVFTRQPSMGRIPWPVPESCATHDLAAWCGWSDGELDWFSDLKQLNSRNVNAALRHYSYHWLPKPRGGYRLLEAPKPQLKSVQRRILHQVLDQVPVHEVARTLTGLCTTVTPAAVLGTLPTLGFREFRDPHALAARERLKRRLAARHLVQGAPFHRRWPIWLHFAWTCGSATPRAGLARAMADMQMICSSRAARTSRGVRLGSNP